jgi:hypothetical protein
VISPLVSAILDIRAPYKLVYGLLSDRRLLLHEARTTGTQIEFLVPGDTQIPAQGWKPYTNQPFDSRYTYRIKCSTGYAYLQSGSVGRATPGILVLMERSGTKTPLRIYCTRHTDCRGCVELARACQGEAESISAWLESLQRTDSAISIERRKWGGLVDRALANAVGLDDRGAEEEVAHVRLTASQEDHTRLGPIISASSIKHTHWVDGRAGVIWATDDRGCKVGYLL